MASLLTRDPPEIEVSLTWSVPIMTCCSISESSLVEPGGQAARSRRAVDSDESSEETLEKEQRQELQRMSVEFTVLSSDHRLLPHSPDMHVSGEQL